MKKKVNKSEKKVNRKRNVRADSLMFEMVIFLVVNVVFFIIMLLFVQSAGSKAFVYERVYSKELALLIDNAKPGMEIELDVSKYYEFAEKNKFTGKIIEIDNEKNKVKIRLTQGGGYEYVFFRGLDVAWNIKKEEKSHLLILKFFEKQETGQTNKEGVENGVI